MKELQVRLSPTLARQVIKVAFFYASANNVFHLHDCVSDFSLLQRNLFINILYFYVCFYFSLIIHLTLYRYFCLFSGSSFSKVCLFLSSSLSLFLSLCLSLYPSTYLYIYLSFLCLYLVIFEWFFFIKCVHGS